jgi:hypothetical protein
MGRKGVSKRKPKKNKSESNDKNNGSSNASAGKRSPVGALMDDKSAPLNRGGSNPSTGSKKSQKNR